MATTFEYVLNSHWVGPRDSVGQLSATGLHTEFSVPREFQGPGIGTNPEQLLLGAAASCYLITLATLLGNRQIAYDRIQLESKAYIENDKGLRIDRIEHRPTVVVDAGTSEDDVLRLAQHAELTCMVSSALRGNVEVKVLPQVLVSSTKA